MRTMDKFGHFRGFQAKRGPPGVGFVLDEDGNYDMQNKRLKKVGMGKDKGDVITMDQFMEHQAMIQLLYKGVIENLPKNLPAIIDKWLQEHKEKVLIPLMTEVTEKTIKEKCVAVDAEGNYDMKNTRLKRVEGGNELSDAVNMGQLKIFFEQLIKEVDENFPKKIEKFIEGKNVKLVAHIREIVNIVFNEKKPSLESGLKANCRDYVDSKYKKKVEDMEKEIRKIKVDAKEELKSITEMTRAFIYKITGPGFARNSEGQEAALHAKLKQKESTWRHAFPEVA